MSKTPPSLPLGEFSQKAESPGLRFWVKADVQAVRYDPSHPEDRRQMGRLIDEMLYMGAETIGRTVQAVLTCAVKHDKEGADKVREEFARAMGAMAEFAATATVNAVKTGSAMPRLVVAQEAPPLAPQAPVTKPPLKIIRD